MSRTIYWSTYETWLKCPQLYSYTYNDHLPKEPVQAGSPLDWGIRVGKALANRLRDPAWKPTIAFNRNLGSLEGLTQVLKEYDARYASDRLLGPWRAEELHCRQAGPDSPHELGCIVDGHATKGDLIRETKVTDRPNIYLYRAQLLWNCFCAGVQQGELDIILRPGYSRPDWAFERLTFIFTEKEKLGLLADVEKFLELSNHLQLWKNPNNCTFCPHTRLCWGEIQP